MSEFSSVPSHDILLQPVDLSEYFEGSIFDMYFYLYEK